MPDQGKTRDRIPRTAIFFALLAFCFYAVASWWGVPQGESAQFVKSWGVDDETPLGPMTEMHNIIHPKANQWLSYPLFYSFLAMGAYSPYLAYLFITGGFSAPSGEFPFGFADPAEALRNLTVIAHLVSAALGGLAVGAAYFIGSTLSGRATARLYALLVMFSFPLVYYARNGNVDAASLAFSALALAVFAHIATRGFAKKSALWLAVFVGLALASKESAVGLFLAMPVLLVFWQFRPHRDGISRMPTGTFVKLAVLSTLVSFIAFGIGSGLFVDPDRYFAHVRYLQELFDIVADSETSVASTYPYTLAGNFGYVAEMTAKTASAMSVPGLLAAIIGVFTAIRHRSPAIVLAVLAFVYLIQMLTSYRLAQMRFLMPLIFVMLFYVAYAATESRPFVLRAVAVALAGLAVVATTLTAVDFTNQMLRDSRYEASDWLEEQTTTGDVIAYFGTTENLPHLPLGVAAEIATPGLSMYDLPRIDDEQVNEILQKWANDPPRFILIIPDHTQPYGVPYPHTVPPQLYEGLMAGAFGYRLIEEIRTPEMFGWLPKPVLDYPMVNPPIRIFAPETSQ